MFEAAVSLLAINYRIGPMEAGLLSLLNEEIIGDVARAAIDQTAFEQYTARQEINGLVMRKPVPTIDD